MSASWEEAMYDSMNEGADRQLGALVNLIDTVMGAEQADILERSTLTYESRGTYHDFGTEHLEVQAVLTVHPADRVTLATHTLEAMMTELTAWVTDDDISLRSELRVRIEPAPHDWRDQRRSAREDPERAAKNQARHVTRPWTADGLRFESEGELHVYRCLKAIQGELPATNTIGIIPGPGIQTGERVFWPDVLITYGGRVGAIEIDGPHHQGRAAADHTRDRYLRDAGIGYLERLPIEDTNDADQLRAWARTFLERVTRS